MHELNCCVIFAAFAFQVAVIQSLTFSPDNQLADCFRQNAIRSIGSTCFAKRKATFGQEFARKKKQYAFIKHIVEKCGSSLPFPSDTRHVDVSKDFINGLPVGDFQPVTGKLQVGDIIVDRRQFNIVVKLGKYSVKLNNGARVNKGKQRALWKEINDQDKDWLSVASFSDPAGLITAADLPGSCKKDWKVRTSIPERKISHLEVTRATKKSVKAARRFYFRPEARVYRNIKIIDPINPNAQGEVTAFQVSAISSQPALGSYDPIQFSHTILKIPDVIFSSSTTFTVPQSGLIFGWMSVANKVGQHMSALFQNNGMTYGVEIGVNDDPSAMGEVRGRVILEHLQGGLTTSVEYMGEVPNQAGTFWGACDLSTAMNPLVGFASSALSSGSSPGPLSLSAHMYYSQNFDGTQFTAPRTGIYFISASIGFNLGQAVQSMITKNGANAQRLIMTATGYSEPGSVSTGSLHQLTEGDTISLVLQSGTAYSGSLRLTSLNGFLYSPRHEEPVAWSVLSTTSRDTGDADPLPFDTINLNTGFAWNKDTNKVTISVPGIYFVFMTVTGKSSFGVDARMVLPESQAADPSGFPKVRSDIWNGDITGSSGGFFHLSAGDEVYVMSFRSSTGGPLSETSFHGMLIYKD